MKFLVVVEKSKTGFAAYSPDVLGCIATGRTRRTTERAMREAMAMHVDAMLEAGQPSPVPRTYAAWVEIPPRRAGRRHRAS